MYLTKVPKGLICYRAGSCEYINEPLDFINYVIRTLTVFAYMIDH